MQLLDPTKRQKDVTMLEIRGGFPSNLHLTVDRPF